MGDTETLTSQWFPTPLETQAKLELWKLRRFFVDLEDL